MIYVVRRGSGSRLGWPYGWALTPDGLGKTF